MRICLVSQEYPPETAKGGIGTQTLMKAEGMVARGHEVHVISRSADANRHERSDGRINVTRLAGSTMGLYTDIADWLMHSAAVAAEIASIHQTAPLDLADFPEWGAEGYVHLLNRSEWNYIPTVIHLHGPLVMFTESMGWPEMDSELYRTGFHMESTCVRLADAIFSSSDCSSEWCVRRYGARPGIPRIHTGIDTRLFHPIEGVKSERPTIVFVGKLADNKGVRVLTEAACRLRKRFPDLCLRLIGTGEKNLVNELREKVLAQGAEDLLDLPGFVARTDLPRELSRAHIFAAPSKYEGGPGFVYLEAMACGLPAIACEGSGAAEVITRGETGFLVPASDPDALVAILEPLLADLDRCAAMGANGRRYVEQEADSEKCLDQIERFYLDTIARARATAVSGST